MGPALHQLCFDRRTEALGAECVLALETEAYGGQVVIRDSLLHQLAIGGLR